MPVDQPRRFPQDGGVGKPDLEEGCDIFLQAPQGPLGIRAGYASFALSAANYRPGFERRQIEDNDPGSVGGRNHFDRPIRSLFLS